MEKFLPFILEDFCTSNIFNEKRFYWLVEYSVSPEAGQVGRKYFPPGRFDESIVGACNIERCPVMYTKLFIQPLSILPQTMENYFPFLAILLALLPKKRE